MKWSKALTVLAKRKKIDSAAMFDLQGNLLSRTDNFAEKQEHVEAVLRVLGASSSHLKLLKLRVFGDVFTCVSPAGPGGVLLAHTEDRLFVGVRSPCCVVIAFANQLARGSCLYEVMEFTKLLENKVCPYSKPYTLPEPLPSPSSSEDPGERHEDGEASLKYDTCESSDEDSGSCGGDSEPSGEFTESYEEEEDSEASESSEDPPECSGEHREFSEGACPSYADLYPLPESPDEHCSDEKQD